MSDQKAPPTVEAILAAYDTEVRRNTTPEWDALRAVATCDEGYQGAFGEVLDTAEELGYPTPIDDAFYDLLEEAFRAYQTRLVAELAAEKPKHERPSLGLPYAAPDFDPDGTYYVACPVCGEKCRAVQPLTEDTITKGAGEVYAAHFVAEAEAGR